MKFLLKLLPLFFISTLGYANIATIGINTCQDLQNINQNLSADYVLNQDIDCANFPWEVIAGTFTGSLDGQEHKIINLTINSTPSRTSSYEGIAGGIFTVMKNATVKNLYIKDAQLNVNPLPIAGIASVPESSMISEIHKMNKSSDALISSGFLSALIDNCTLSKVAFSNTQINLDQANAAVMFGFMGGAEKASKLSEIFIHESNVSAE